MKSKIETKTFFTCMTILVLMFIHLVGLIENCNSQLDSERYVISAFNA